MMERQGRYVGCEMEGGTHSQGHLHTPGSEGLHPGEGRQAKKKGVSILGVRGQAKERGCHPGGGKG